MIRLASFSAVSNSALRSNSSGASVMEVRISGRHGNKLEPLKGKGWARVSIPCPVTVPAMEQD
jgi:hypothetical protein